jgi:hypothetical protein
VDQEVFVIRTNHTNKGENKMSIIYQTRPGDIDWGKLRADTAQTELEKEFIESDSQAVIQENGSIRIYPALLRLTDSCTAIRLDGRLVIASTVPGFARIEKKPEHRTEPIKRGPTNLAEAALESRRVAMQKLADIRNNRPAVEERAPHRLTLHN